MEKLFKKDYIIGIIVGIISVIAILSYMNNDTPVNVVQAGWREDAQKEFQGAYEEDMVNGDIVEYTLTADETTLQIGNDTIDNMWSYNGQIPGPALEAYKGDILKITLVNNLPQPTTIHWHGVRVDNEMDGVPDVTQKPVQPGESFTYEVKLKDAGTFWYHPHVRSSEQLERGLYGSLVVKDRNEPEYDQDLVMVLDDISLVEGILYPNFNTPHDLSHDGRWGNTFLVNGKVNPNFNVKAGERIRLRLINSSNGRVYRPNLIGTKATVIAVDGLLVKEPFSYTNFDLAPGNRIDLDITVPNTSSINIVDNFTRYTNQLAQIIVNGTTDTIKTFSPPSATSLPDWDNIPLEPDVTYKLNARRGGMMGIEWTINDESYPELTIAELKKGEVSVLSYKNISARLHPMHIHGQFFKVIGRNGKKVNEPYWRDTVLVGPREEVIVAMVPLDEGSWVNHCHILEHAEAGMITAIKVK